MLKSRIVDGTGKEVAARVTRFNELVTNRYTYSEAYSVSATVINTAYNFVGPMSNRRFVITDILLYANKDVGAGDASVELYEASAADSTTVDKTILSIEMLKQTSRDLTSLNLIVTAGKWVNIKTNDNTIFATIMGYYVQEVKDE